MLGFDSRGFMVVVIVVFLFFGLIVLYELGYVFVVKCEGIGVVGIDLFFFGGFMKAMCAL